MTDTGIMATIPKPTKAKCKSPLCQGKGFWTDPWGDDPFVKRECYHCRGTGKIDTVWGFDVNEYDLSKVIWGFHAGLGCITPIERYVWNTNIGDYWHKNRNSNIKGPGFIHIDLYHAMHVAHSDKEQVKQWHKAITEYQKLLSKAFTSQ
jgi:hypothetical protein